MFITVLGDSRRRKRETGACGRVAKTDARDAYFESGIGGAAKVDWIISAFAAALFLCSKGGELGSFL